MKLQVIQNKIYELRGQKVMLDFDLAEMYNVETRVLKQAVRRNIKRFPDDFMFVLKDKEINTLVSQSVIPSKSKFGGALPFAFTEQGVSMLASVLKSNKAIQVNIAKIEKEMSVKFKDIHQALNFLLQKETQEKDQSQRKKIGYK